MTTKSKGDVQVPHPEATCAPESALAHKPYWEPVTHGYHRTTETHSEEFNSKWVDAAKVRSLEEIGQRVRR